MSKRRVPKYRHFKSKDLAMVEIAGKVIYLGKYGTPESHAEYSRLVQEYLAAPATKPSGNAAHPDGPTVNELILAYWEQHVASYYMKNGRPTSEQSCIKQAMRFLRPEYGHTRANDFGPLALKVVRKSLISSGRCRAVINKDVNRIRRMFRWATEHEMVPVTVFQALKTVPDLRAGRSSAKESKPVRPVSEEHVQATLPHVPLQISAMIRLQLLTGARPGEITAIRPCDVQISEGPVWVYRPQEHKTEHHDRQRLIPIGPRAQEILRPWLDRDASSHCFSPAEAMESWNARRRQARKTPMTPSQAKRERKAKPKRLPGPRYTRDSYRQAIGRACLAADIPPWHPNQLRHTRATEIRSKFGIEAAQTILGHSKADVTQVYAERDLAKAVAIMGEIG